MAAYAERKMYHDCSIKLIHELETEKRFSWKKMRKAMTLAALLSANRPKKDHPPFRRHKTRTVYEQEHHERFDKQEINPILRFIRRLPSQSETC